MTGKIMKGIGGFYYVYVEAADCMSVVPEESFVTRK